MKRLATSEDFDSVYQIYMDESVIPFLGYDPMSKDHFRPVFDGLVSSKSFFVYELKGEIVGFFKIARYPGRASHVAYIGPFAVKPSHQGSGLARTIMQNLFDELKAQQVKRFELIVESDNPRAIRFYEKFGFKVEGTLKKFYKRSGQDFYIDDHIMALIVD